MSSTPTTQVAASKNKPTMTATVSSQHTSLLPALSGWPGCMGICTVGKQHASLQPACAGEQAVQAVQTALPHAQERRKCQEGYNKEVWTRGPFSVDGVEDQDRLVLYALGLDPRAGDVCPADLAARRKELDEQVSCCCAVHSQMSPASHAPAMT